MAEPYFRDETTASRMHARANSAAEADNIESFAADFRALLSGVGWRVDADPSNDDLRNLGLDADPSDVVEPERSLLATVEAQVALSIGLFIGKQAASWAAGRVFDRVWKQSIPLFEVFRKTPLSGDIQTSNFFESSGLTVITIVKKGAAPEAIMGAIRNSLDETYLKDAKPGTLIRRYDKDGQLLESVHRPG